jgi:NAD(P)-dependent dehydrogenase (short-subunit alcohol dehydrogenase family)
LWWLGTAWANLPLTARRSQRERAMADVEGDEPLDLELRDKVAVVTGGNRGIGKAVAWQLAKEGVDVALLARDRALLEAAAAEIAQATKRRVKGYVADTGDDAAVKTAIAQVLGEFGRVDILVNCAAAVGGVGKPPKLAEITNEPFFADMNVKVMGYVRTIREIAPHMAAQGGGRIINISGLAALSTGSTIGSIRNVGVAALTKNLADELAPSGISAVCVHPGRTRTEKTAEFVERQAEAQGVAPDEVERRLAAGNLVGQVITAEEIAYLVAFLASPKSIAINGDSIAAGGGSPGPIHY